MKNQCTKALILFFCFWGLTQNIKSQDLPSTDVYLFTLTERDNGYDLKYPKFMTGFNLDGYNNQPSFASDFDIYISSNYGDNGSTEIVKLNLFEKKLTRLTNTIESEYSPTLANKNFISTVRVEQNGTDQALILYPKDMDGTPKRLLPDINNVGYHTWLSSEDVALFLVNEDKGHILAFANVYTEKVNQVISNIGRTLKYDGKETLYFISKSPDRWFIKSANTKTRQVKTVAETLPMVEDFELLKDGTFLAGKGSKLYYFKPNKTAGWTVINDLGDYGVQNISRLVVRKNRLAIVSQAQ